MMPNFDEPLEEFEEYMYGSGCATWKREIANYTN